MSARISRSTFDEHALAMLDHDLHALDEPWADALRHKVISMRRALAAKTGPRWWHSFELPAPDGRSLHSYRLPSASLRAIEAHLRLPKNLQNFGQGDLAALFALWAAEWFRRNFAGGQLRWDTLGNVFGIHLSQAEWRDIADRGLAAWRIRPLRLHGATHRLLNLARQGGFPLAAVEAGGSTWAQAHLGRLVGILLAEPSPTVEIGLRHAEALREDLPSSWQYQDFHVVSADLALAVVSLRQDAEASGAPPGVPASVWLDAHRPDWRDRLPFGIDSDAGRRIIDGLMQIAAAKGGASEVRATRIFERQGDSWVEALSLDLNGRLRIPGLTANDWSRLRMLGDAKLARYSPGELAIVEPDRDGVMLVRATGAGRGDLAVPFSIPVTVELRGGGQRVGTPFLLPNGEALDAPLIVTHGEVEKEDAVPQRLIVVGAGSGRYRANPLHIFVPLDWQVSGGNNEHVRPEECGHDGRRLWRIEGGATITNPLGDRYRLLTGQPTDDRDLLLMHGQTLGHLRTIGAPPNMILGRPTFTIRERGSNCVARNGEIWWRRVGERGWNPIATFDALGPCQFAWRDPDAALIRDIQTATILPKDFEATLLTTAGQQSLQVRGWPGDLHVEPAQPGDNGCWQIILDAVQQTDAVISLGIAGSRPLQLSIRVPHRAFIADWSGQRQPMRARVALAELHRFVARSSGRCILQAQLRDRDRRRVEEADLHWSFEGELPLNSIREELAALLRPLGDIDAIAELQFSDSSNVAISVCEFGIVLKQNLDGMLPEHVLTEAMQVIGRATHKPLEERLLGVIAPSETIEPIVVPRLPGTWLVYLRRHDRVLSRPVITAGPPLAAPPSCPLSRTMAIEHWRTRQQALQSLCVKAEAAGPESIVIIRATIALAAKLDGLPPHTFDILQAVAKQPLLAARLVYEASDSDLEAIMALPDALPFAWPTICREWWDTAAQLRFDGLLAALPDSIQLPERIALAARVISARRSRIAEIDPAIGAILDQHASVIPIDDTAQSFVREVHDRPGGLVRSPFRPFLASRLPDWRFDEAYWRGLDAPCAAALACAGLAILNDPQRRCVKDVARRYPRHFRQAFAVFLKDHCHG